MRKLRTLLHVVFILAIGAGIPSTAEEVHFIAQCRVIDTRVPTTGIGGPNTGSPVLNGAPYRALVRESWAGAGIQGGTAGCSVPTTAKGVILNLTVIGIGSGWMEVYPWNARPTPPQSRINWSTGQTIANEITVQLHPLPLNFPGSDSWDLEFRPIASPAHIIADLIGYTKDAFPSFPFGVMQGVVVDKFQDHGTTHLLVEPPGGDCTPFHHDTCYMVECAPYEFANEVCLVASVGECVEIEGFHRPNAGDDHWVGRLIRTVGNPPCPWD